MQLVQHHVKYKEIDGVDEVVLIPRSEHTVIHKQLRKKGLIKTPIGVLDKISQKAHKRISDRICFQENMMRNVFLIEDIKHNQVSGQVSVSSYFHTRERTRTDGDRKYEKSVRRNILFRETVAPYIIVFESIGYNEHTGYVGVASGFSSKLPVKLYTIKEV